jgi:hypothetical protein
LDFTAALEMASSFVKVKPAAIMPVKRALAPRPRRRNSRRSKGEEGVTT